MVDTLAITWQFRVKLLKAAEEEAGSNPGPPPQAPGGDVQLGEGGFQECSGLEVEMDVVEYNEGGRNDGVIRQAGRAKYQNLVLKRGMFVPEGGDSVDRALWQWFQDAVSGVKPIPRYNGIVEVLDPTFTTVVATWEFDRGLPAKVTGPQLNAQTGEVAIEELHIAHEGLRLGEG